MTEIADNASSTERAERCSKIISSAMAWSAAASFIPLPYVDLVALGAVQAKMVSELARIYKEDPSSEVSRGLVSVLLGTLLPAGATSGVMAIVSSSSKVVPGVGTAIGVASMAGFGAAATYAIGKVFVRHFESGGTLSNFSAESIKEDLKAEFSRAKNKQSSATA
jgi:uncharacterized protein (DUF697 family)